MKRRWCLIALACGSAGAGIVHAEEAVDRAQDAVVKLYGAGGFVGLESHQTGVVLGPAGVEVITADSVALELGVVTVIDAVGERCEGRVVGRDAETGLALIALPDGVAPPGAIDLSRGREPLRAEALVVLSNAFAIATGDEPVTVQRARVAAVTAIPLSPDGRKVAAIGAPRPGTRVLLLDRVTSNPGAAGGLVIDARGEAVGLLGAEVRSDVTGAWINYALPATTVAEAVARLRAGTRDGEHSLTDAAPEWRSTLWRLGVALVPSLSDRTPAYVEAVATDSPADRAGLRADDLVVSVGGASAGDVESAGGAVARGLARGDTVEVGVLRGGEVLTLALGPGEP